MIFRTFENISTEKFRRFQFFERRFWILTKRENCASSKVMLNCRFLSTKKVKNFWNLVNPATTQLLRFFILTFLVLMLEPKTQHIFSRVVGLTLSSAFCTFLRMRWVEMRKRIYAKKIFKNWFKPRGAKLGTANGAFS